MKEANHFNGILNTIQFNLKYSTYEKYSGIVMLQYIIKLIGEEDFNAHFKMQFFDDFYKDYSFDEKFAAYHKSLRQVDCFENGLLDGLLYEFYRFSDIPYKIIKEYLKDLENDFSFYK